MRDVKEGLDAVLAQSQFDLGRFEQRPEGRTLVYRGSKDESVPPDVLKDLAASRCWDDEEAARARHAKLVVPEVAFDEWSSSVEKWLEDYVNRETDSIGHAFPMESGKHSYARFEAQGAMSECYVSSVDDFARVLVRGAAIMGSARLVGMLSGWLAGEGVGYRTAAVLNGLYLTDKLAPLPGIRIEPLPRSTDGDFGSLPVLGGRSIKDYLGRSVLSLESIARPAFFRPEKEGYGSKVHAEFTSGVGLDTVCRALALESDTPVDVAFEWNDYADMSRYLSPGSRSTRSRRRGGIEPLGVGSSLSTDYATGVSTVVIDDGSVCHPSDRRLKSALRAMAKQGGSSVDVAIARWCKSKEGFSTLADKAIDLRVALEALYLKDFDRKNRGEMKFRLAVYGAWHVGSDFAERKEIRKTLADAYAMGSMAVHGDPLSSSRGGEALLSRSQELCRRGILKFLEHGFQETWDDMILGAKFEKRESETSD
ncbi:MAG: hypothetical protein F4053_13050 [Proteobacteria bacterium]|nr:hypothetical protein [Pseudomonadota bacterium]